MAITDPASSTPSGSDSLPEMLREFFWDTDFEKVSWRDNRDYVIRRVLSVGSWDAVCWLRTRLDNAALHEWIVQHEGRGLSSRQLRFWEVVLDLPSAEVDEWLQNEGRKIWEGRGRG
jgi:hypothetical protein